MSFSHKSVLLEECLDVLDIKAEGIYLDATFGRGGHSRAILAKLSDKGRLYALDRDLEALEEGKKINDSRFSITHAEFANLLDVANEYDLVGKVDGILMDIGVSSPQLDDKERGFSFMHDGPLDMRMDKSSSLDAATIVNTYELDDLTRIFRDYGEERFAYKVAKAIIQERENKPFTRTLELANLLEKVIPFSKTSHKHKATRVFQALRIEVNGELEQLQKALEATIKVLKKDGILAVISFHSLEDRIVKQFINHYSTMPKLPSNIPLTEQELQQRFKDQVIFAKASKAIKANVTELNANARARSAVLRAARKL